MSEPARERLIVMARWPEAGVAKTRLIPKLGQQGAADLHRHMVRHTLRTVDALVRRRPVNVEVRFDGGDAERMAGLFGDGRRYVPQGAGDLGERMNRAFADALNAGAGRVVMIGTDCPGITADLLGRALDALGDADVVLGPAADGGYYLIGMTRLHPGLFRGIDWGTDAVLAQTRQTVRDARLTDALLEELHDVDRPEDLPHWERAYHRSVSVVIPARNEAGRIGRALEIARAHGDAELIVVDGHSSDRTADVAREHGAQVIDSKPGRAVQMNLGADAAGGDVLLFCHADTHLPEEYDRLAADALDISGVVAGAFGLRIRGEGWRYRLIEWGVRKRCAWRALPYGDQGIFIRRSAFERLGGYRDLAVMEDYDLIQRAKGLGEIVTANGDVTTSARYWEHHGPLCATLRNQRVLWGWRLGVSPARLARWRSGGSTKKG